MTAVSSALQYGHFMSGGCDPLRALGRAVYRVPPAQVRDLGADALRDLLVARRLEHVRDQAGEALGLGFAESARGHRGRADTDAARDEGLLRIVGDGVLVHRDVRAAQGLFGVLAGDALRAQVEQ